MKKPLDLENIAKTIRKIILTISYESKVGHIGSSFSIVEILVILYFSFLRINPRKPKWHDRDRFILSKGHAAPALYATLALRGFFPQRNLSKYCKDKGLLEEHPKHTVLGIEISTGSLGHGISIGAGMAISAKLRKKNFRVVVLMSDAECDEGETWESALFASHHHLQNLIVLLDYNKVQAFGSIEEVLQLEPLTSKWRAFGWNVLEVDGHSMPKLLSTIKKTAASANKPSIIICHTVRGKGVTFMEHTIDWHYLNPKKEQYYAALEEID
ncbi:transketolase [Candidatus Gottesmanbacteria bacterium]|nr:transketolase [Candidatus Gottesmanbacteria bacterium]